MEIKPPMQPTPEELAKTGAKKRREAFGKTKEENEKKKKEKQEEIVKLRGERADIDLMIKELERKKAAKANKEGIESIKNKLVALVERKKLLNKKLKMANDRSLLDRINVLSGAEGSGIKGRDERIKILGDIYGEDFVKANILEKKGVQDDNVKDLLRKAGDELEEKLSKSGEMAGGDVPSEEERKKILREMKALKHGAKKLEARGVYEDEEASPAKPSEPKPGDTPESEEPKRKLEDTLKEMHLENQKTIDKEGLEYHRDTMDIPGKEKDKDVEDLKEKELKKALDDARMAFVRKDEEASSKLSWLKGIFPRLRRGNKTEDMGAVHGTYDAYMKAVEAYKNFKIQKLQEKYGSMSPEELSSKQDEMNKEMGDLVKEFNLDQKVELYDARTQAKLDKRKESWSGRMVNRFENCINCYRKLGFKKQMLISAALFATGAGAAFAGSAFLAGTVGAAGLTRRFFGGASAGFGAVRMQEGGRRWLERRQSGKDVERTMAELGNETDIARKLELLSGKLSGEMDVFRSSYEREKEKSKNRKRIGWATFTGAIVLPSFVSDYLWGAEAPSGVIGTGPGSPDSPYDVPSTDSGQGGPGSPFGPSPEASSPDQMGPWAEPSASPEATSPDQMGPWAEPSASPEATSPDQMGPWVEPKVSVSPGAESPNYEPGPYGGVTPGIPEPPHYEPGPYGGASSATPEPPNYEPGPGAEHPHYEPGIGLSDSAEHPNYEGGPHRSESSVGSGDLEKLESDLLEQNKSNASAFEYPDAPEKPAASAFEYPETAEPSPEPVKPVVSGIETAKRGDSVWKMLNRQLAARYGEEYDTFSPEQKTYIIDHFKDEVAKDPQKFGLKNIDKVKIGQKIDFSSLFENESKVGDTFIKADDLKPEEIKSIARNNRTILNWVKVHPGESLTSPKVDEILGDRGGRGGGGDARWTPFEGATDTKPSGGARPSGKWIPFTESAAVPEVKGKVNLIELLSDKYGVNPERAQMMATDWAYNHNQDPFKVFIDPDAEIKLNENNMIGDITEPAAPEVTGTASGRMRTEPNLRNVGVKLRKEVPGFYDEKTNTYYGELPPEVIDPESSQGSGMENRLNGSRIPEIPTMKEEMDIMSRGRLQEIADNVKSPALESRFKWMADNAIYLGLGSLAGLTALAAAAEKYEKSKDRKNIYGKKGAYDGDFEKMRKSSQSKMEILEQEGEETEKKRASLNAEYDKIFQSVFGKMLKEWFSDAKDINGREDLEKYDAAAYLKKHKKSNLGKKYQSLLNMGFKEAKPRKVNKRTGEKGESLKQWINRILATVIEAEVVRKL